MMKMQTTHKIKPRILVADDSEITRKSVRRILAEDFEVCEVGGGREALAQLRTDRDFHTLFVDIMMPGLDGFEVLRTLRASKDGYLRHLPVIMMTTDEDSATLRRKAVVMGATDFITKPFDSLILKTRAKAHARVPDDYVPQKTEAESKVALNDDLVEIMDYNEFQRYSESRIDETYQKNQSVSLLYLKVDAFEALCHITGKREANSVMQQTGDLIASQLRQQDSIAALGEGNFVVFMPDTNSLVAKEMAKCVFTTVRKCHPDLGNMRISITLSGGMVSNSAENPHSLEKLENIASGRLKKAIEEGGNQLVYADLKKKKIKKGKQKLSLISALKSLRDGDADAVDHQISELLEETFPLLVVANTKMKLGIDDALRRIQASLDDVSR